MALRGALRFLLPGLQGLLKEEAEASVHLETGVIPISPMY